MPRRIRSHESLHKCSTFPTFAVIVMVVAVIWFLSDLAVITINIPWIPLIVGIIAIGMIINHCKK